MAITFVAPANANLADNFSSLTITTSRVRTYWSVVVKVNGVTVMSKSDITGTGIVLYPTSAIRDAIWSAAQGSSLTDAVSITVTEYDAGPSNIAQATLSGGDLTITYRCSNLVLSAPTSSNKMNLNLAAPTDLVASWTRPHTAFRARLKFYVFNGSTYTLIFNRYGFTSSTAISVEDVAGNNYIPAMIAAMNNFSPRACKLELYTQFLSDSYQDLGTMNDDAVQADSIQYSWGGKIKAFGTSFLAKPIKVWNGTLWAEKPLKHWTGTEWKRSKD